MIQVFLRICGDDIVVLVFLCWTFGRHSELVLTRCCVRGLFRNGQGAAELAFGSDTAALSLLILSSPLVLTQQSVRTQFRVV